MDNIDKVKKFFSIKIPFIENQVQKVQRRIKPINSKPNIKTEEMSFDEISVDTSIKTIANYRGDSSDLFTKVLSYEDYYKLEYDSRKLSINIDYISKDIEALNDDIKNLEDTYNFIMGGDTGNGKKLLTDEELQSIYGISDYRDIYKKINELKATRAELSNTLYNYKEIRKLLKYDYLMKSDEYKDFTFSDLDYNVDGKTIFEIESSDSPQLMAEKIRKAGFNSEEEFDLYSKLYFLPADDRKTYFYLKSKDSTLADNFLEDIQDTINLTRGKVKADIFIKSLDEAYYNDPDRDLNLVKNYMKTAFKGENIGVNTFFEGLYNIPFADGIRSDTDYEKLLILQALSENKQYGEYLAETFQFSQSVGNMLPSIAASALVTAAFAPAGAAMAEGSLASDAVAFGLSAQKIGQLTGVTLMGLSAGGNATEASLQKGHSRASSYLYGAINGLSEATLEHLIGNIPGLSSAAELSIKGIIKEGIEESSQEVIDAIVNNIMYGEEINLSELASQSADAFTAGIGISMLFGGGEVVINDGIQTITLTANQLSSIYSKGGTQSVVDYYKSQLGSSGTQSGINRFSMEGEQYSIDVNKAIDQISGGYYNSHELTEVKADDIIKIEYDNGHKKEITYKQLDDFIVKEVGDNGLILNQNYKDPNNYFNVYSTTPNEMATLALETIKEYRIDDSKLNKYRRFIKNYYSSLDARSVALDNYAHDELIDEINSNYGDDIPGTKNVKELVADSFRFFKEEDFYPLGYADNVGGLHIDNIDIIKVKDENSYSDETKNKIVSKSKNNLSFDELLDLMSRDVMFHEAMHYISDNNESGMSGFIDKTQEEKNRMSSRRISSGRGFNEATTEYLTMMRPQSFYSETGLNNSGYINGVSFLAGLDNLGLLQNNDNLYSLAHYYFNNKTNTVKNGILYARDRAYRESNGEKLADARLYRDWEENFLGCMDAIVYGNGLTGSLSRGSQISGEEARIRLLELLKIGNNYFKGKELHYDQ